MKFTTFILAIMSCCFFAISNINASTTPLEGIGRPLFLKVDTNNIYVTEETEILVFSRKTNKLIYKLGKKGAGPGEFIDLPVPQLLEDNIMVSSDNKLSFFKYDGSFIKDTRINTSSSFIKKVAENKYVGYNIKREPDEFYLTYNLLDHEFKIVKELCRGPWILHKNKTMDVFEIFFFDTYKGKIIFAHRDGFKVDVLDQEGTLIAKIRPENKPVPFTDESKKEVINFWEIHPQYQVWRKKMVFPKNYPSIRSCAVSDNKIYIITYLQKDKKSECFIYDLKGNFVKRIFVPFKSEFGAMGMYPFDIYKGTLFQLVDNFETETWTIDSTPL